MQSCLRPPSKPCVVPSMDWLLYWPGILYDKTVSKTEYMTVVLGAWCLAGLELIFKAKWKGFAPRKKQCLPSYLLHVKVLINKNWADGPSFYLLVPDASQVLEGQVPDHVSYSNTLIVNMYCRRAWLLPLSCYWSFTFSSAKVNQNSRSLWG